MFLQAYEQMMHMKAWDNGFLCIAKPKNDIPLKLNTTSFCKLYQAAVLYN